MPGLMRYTKVLKEFIMKKFLFRLGEECVSMSALFMELLFMRESTIFRINILWAVIWNQISTLCSRHFLFKLYYCILKVLFWNSALYKLATTEGGKYQYCQTPFLYSVETGWSWTLHHRHSAPERHCVLHYWTHTLYWIPFRIFWVRRLW